MTAFMSFIHKRAFNPLNAKALAVYAFIFSAYFLVFKMFFSNYNAKIKCISLETNLGIQYSEAVLLPLAL